MSPGYFPSTRRSVLAASRDADPTIRREALGAIVEAYWKPAYKHIRLKWKASADDAGELTQSFFTSLLERDLVARYDPNKAAFRTYLRTCIDGYVGNQRKSDNRLKRGGDVTILSLDFQQAESELSAAGSTTAPFEDVFYREWQRHMFSLAVQDLRRQCDSSGKAVRFALFERYDMSASRPPSYEDLAAQFGLPATTVTNHLAWARRELRRCLLERLAAITSGESELRSEAGRLLGPSV